MFETNLKYEQNKGHFAAKKPEFVIFKVMLSNWSPDFVKSFSGSQVSVWYLAIFRSMFVC